MSSVIDVSPIVVRSGTGKAGRHYLSGVVSVDNTPVRMRRVVLMRRDTLRVLDVRDSDENGTVVFQGMEEQPGRSLMMIAMDVVDGEHNAYVADFLSQETTTP